MLRSLVGSEMCIRDRYQRRVRGLWVRSMLEFHVNGEVQEIRDQRHRHDMSLAEYLRAQGWTGTKIGCGQGGCGACTVMLSSFDLTLDRIVHRKVNACLTPLWALQGTSVTTVEGLRAPLPQGADKVSLDPVHEMHPVQLHIAELHGSQCGFCTPGMVMSLYTMLKNSPRPTLQELETAYDGNLCRCTGYRPLLDAAKTFASDRHALHDKCAGSSAELSSRPSAPDKILTNSDNKSRHKSEGFPEALSAGLDHDASTHHSLDGHEYQGKHPEKYVSQPVESSHFKLLATDPDSFCAIPVTIQELVHLRAQHPSLRIFHGNLDSQYYARKHTTQWLVSTRIPEMCQIHRTSQDLRVGSGAHISSFLDKVQEMFSTSELKQQFGLSMICQHFNKCFTPQVRNYSAVCSGISAPDMIPALVAAGASVSIAEADGSATGYSITETPLRELLVKKNVYANLSPTQVVLQVIIPLQTHASGSTQSFCWAFKQGSRRENSAGILSAAFGLSLSNEGVVMQSTVAVSGFAEEVRYMSETEDFLVGQPWNADTVRSAKDHLCKDASSSCWEGRHEYKTVLLLSAFTEFFEISHECIASKSYPSEEERLVSTGVQSWKCRTDTSGLQTTIGMAACNGMGDLEQPGISSKLTQIQPDHMDKTTKPFHLITLASNERHMPANVSPEDPFNNTSHPVGAPEQHAAAYAQASGEAVYVDDIPTPSNCVFAAIVQAPVSLAKIKKCVPTAEILGLRGPDGERVHGYYDATDAAGSSVSKGMRFRHTNVDHTAFTKGFMLAIGNTVGFMVADSQQLADQAAQMMSRDGIEYELESARLLEPPLSGPIYTIDEAIEKEERLAAKREELLADLEKMSDEEMKAECLLFGVQVLNEDERKEKLKTMYSEMFTAYYPYTHDIVQGDVDSVLASCAHQDGGVVVSGTVRVGGQEHFYMEPHALLLEPGEHGEMVLYSMTQCVQKSQRLIASAIGVPCAKVVIKVKRMGGAFGGKETLSSYLTPGLAIAAAKLRRPVRITLTRETDMNISGQRHPFKYEYKAGFSADGLLQALDVQLWNNGGHSIEISREVMDRGQFHAMNAYHVNQAFRTKGTACRTNITSNTAFRGFGATQTMVMTETVMEQAAIALGISREDIVQRNLLKPGARLPYGQQVPQCHLGQMWNELCGQGQLEAARASVVQFNQASGRYKKGLAVVPTMYGINFPVAWLNQGAALVLVYTDGTVLVSHGGTEMGQGLNTKMIQIAAQVFGIETSRVHVAETASDKVPNNPPTAASVGSDIHGMAVLNACEKIKHRLVPFKLRHPDWSFQQLCEAAWFERIDMAAEGYYATPVGAEYDFDMKTDDNSKRGDMWNYFCFGIALAEVTVDTSTGSFLVDKADVIMDVGESLSPAIDIGQVEGAFLQGMGYLTTEELVWGDSAHPWAKQGVLQNAGPHYGIPAPADVPLDLRITLWSPLHLIVITFFVSLVSGQVERCCKSQRSPLFQGCRRTTHFPCSFGFLRHQRCCPSQTGRERRRIFLPAGCSCHL
eukprot:TRINITY_DN1932_c0_g1_i10.p1 TRINITY_DN1932_c0_g1~~TRINITY_DN1932_c0_g1_i10.p1  ORF type:complete len:1546 (-),score=328.16 TRINITY_DN1932_c0_g1_i10:428-4999(-)